jgi:hypothetical protein
MELIGQKLHDFLHDLLIGGNTPAYIMITSDILKYIKARSTNIGKILTVEVELLDSFEKEASRFSEKSVQPFSEFEDLKGSYKIISEHTQKCSYEDFQKRKSTFITASDYAMERKDNNYRLGFMDLKRNFQFILQPINEKYYPAPLLDMKRDLRLNIMYDKDIDEFAVFRSMDVIYDKTYKLELVLFDKKITSFTFEEIKIKYFKYYVPEEFEKFKKELEKYYEYQDKRKHLSIIDFYIDKFSEEVIKQSEASINECFVLFKSELQNLRHDVASFYGHSYKKAINPEKLVWRGSFTEFVEFFEPLINCGYILYKGEKDKFAIYTNLFNNIFIEIESDVMIATLLEKLKTTNQIPAKEVEKCKLTWSSTRSEFVKKFKKPTNMTITDKSLFVYRGVNSLKGIAINLHELFQIENKNRPGKYISKESLIQAFKG